VTSPVIDEDIRSILDLAVPWERLSGARVLVTGATGMVGQYVTRALLGLGEHLGVAPAVIALVQNEAKAASLFADDLSRGSLRLVVQDVAEPFSVDGDLDWVVHAASPANPAAFRDDPVGVVRANVLGTMHSLDLARSAGAGVCLISTMEVYGAATGSDTRLISEQTPGILDSLDPRSAYPESKRLAETLCIAHHQQFGTAYRIARLSHTYGPGMAVDDARVQAYFLRQSLSGADIVLQSDGSMRRTYTYISDAAAAVLCLLLAEDSNTFNIANDDARVSIRELAEAFQRNSPVPGGSVLTKPRTDTGLWSRTAGGTFLDCSRLRGTGWAPRVSIAAGVARTVRHHLGVG
jgi:dTDP-glucose 4,6-dehydratase